MGILYALDSQFGTEKWSHDLVREFDSIRRGRRFGASPLVEGDVVLIEAGGKNGHSLMAFDKTSGEVAWTAGSDERGYSSPHHRHHRANAPSGIFYWWRTDLGRAATRSGAVETSLDD